MNTEFLQSTLAGALTKIPDVRGMTETVQMTRSPKACQVSPRGDIRGDEHKNLQKLPCPLDIVGNRHSNKGTAFTLEERKALRLDGLLPPAVETLEQQISRCEELMDSIQMSVDASTGLMKYIYLTGLRETNETLFYALLQRNIEKYMPFVYTPTVGLGCQKFSHIYNQSSEGLFLSHSFKKCDIARILSLYSAQLSCDPSIIVVTDGSRILGLGDLGINGMGIPIGKLALYVAVGGFHPANILPITLDLGTSNQDNLNDPLYLGQRTERASSEDFFKFTDDFMSAAADLFPNCVIQFEDFENKHCFELLDRNRSVYRCFNDDIQGTGVVAAAGFLSAVKYVEREVGTKPAEHRIVFYGFGSASAGVANQIVSCLQQTTGMAAEDLRKMFYMVDSSGLCTNGRGDHLPEYKLPFTRMESDAPHGASLIETIDKIQPTALIGLSGQGQTFTKAVCEKMAELNKRPIIFALSNPTSKSECLFSEAMEWTKGSVVWAAGSPMPSVGDRISPQGNNLYAFPGIGFGAWLCQASTITEDMMTAATNAISHTVKDDELLNLYPSLTNVANVSDIVAAEVMRVALENKLNHSIVPATHEERIKFVQEHRYRPVYGPAI